MGLHSARDPEPIGPTSGGPQEERKAQHSRVVAHGTLACPSCDAPVLPAAGGMAPGAPLTCPLCDTSGTVRDFLSLATPTRPAHVVVRVTSALDLQVRRARP